MGEEIDSVKKEIKERLTSPFWGKFILSWFIWNWKIPYVTFFVKEVNLEENRLEYISRYLKPDDFWGFIIVYIIPLIITAVLIWVIPYISHIAFEVSEKFRKKKALKKRTIDDEISGFEGETIIRLKKEIKSLNINYKRIDSNNMELMLLVEYLCLEIELIDDKNYEDQKDIFLEQFRNDISNEKKKHQVFALIDGYNASSNKAKYFSDSEDSERKFLSKNGLIEDENSTLRLSLFGEFVSKNRLFDKYGSNMINFQEYRNLDD
ncbi:MAG: hypothetical protein L3J25_03280 [Flavobacteriaceae bacterium]|nr:hypothetical protein [Flavobacteriaceae bacterium]